MHISSDIRKQFIDNMLARIFTDWYTTTFNLYELSETINGILVIATYPCYILLYVGLWEMYSIECPGYSNEYTQGTILSTFGPSVFIQRNLY